MFEEKSFMVLCEGVAVLFVEVRWVVQQQARLTPRLDSVLFVIVRSPLVLGALDMVDNRESAYWILPFHGSSVNLVETGVLQEFDCVETG